MLSNPTKTRFSIREPAVADAAAIWRLVQERGVLDLNSPYCYLILCKDFASTCLVAGNDDGVVGFLSAYIPPETPEIIFLWQIGVAESAQGQGLGSRLVLSLLEQEACRNISYLHTTITPSNTASLRLFQSVARRLQTEYSEQPGFPQDLFPPGTHEEEWLIRIGPLHQRAL